ncbi:hypothetical protein NL676_005655 [Syzygium grande]|nr:hypothetical protein NL676_005655 [Syzygium grande]
MLLLKYASICSASTGYCSRFFIVASQKHYTVEVIVAWYTVSLVVFFIDKKLTVHHATRLSVSHSVSPPLGGTSVSYESDAHHQ